jgi:hypothetical protein
VCAGHGCVPIGQSSQKGRTMKRSFGRAGAWPLAVVFAASASALPRDTITLTNFNSALRPPGAGQSLFIPSAAYTVRFVRIQGTIVQTGASASPSTQSILFTPIDSFVNPSQLSSPFLVGVSSNTSFNGQPLVVDLLVRPPAPFPTTVGGSVTLAAIDTFPQIGDGPVARWNTLTITLDDGPPAPTKNAGALTPRRVPVSVPIAFASTSWVKFELAEDVTAVNGRYLDIDTIGSALTPSNDTIITLYNDNGIRVALDDDSGGGTPARQSLLSFGSGTRPPVGNSAAYAGQNGTLRAGVYWVGVRGWNNPIDGGGPGWNFPSGSNFVGTAMVNLRTNTGSPAACPVDYDGDGTRAPADIFAFLNAYFAGCP